MSLIGQNRAAEAEQELIKTVALDPKNTNAHYNLGVILARDKGDYAKSEASFRNALEVDPRHQPSQFNLSVVLIKLEKWAEAEPGLRAAIEPGPKSFFAHYFLAISLSGQNRLAEAESAFRRSLELESDHADSHLRPGDTPTISRRLDWSGVRVQEGDRVRSERSAGLQRVGRRVEKSWLS